MIYQPPPLPFFPNSFESCLSSIGHLLSMSSPQKIQNVLAVFVFSTSVSRMLSVFLNFLFFQVWSLSIHDQYCSQLLENERDLPATDKKPKQERKKKNHQQLREKINEVVNGVESAERKKLRTLSKRMTWLENRKQPYGFPQDTSQQVGLISLPLPPLSLFKLQLNTCK